MSFDEWGKFTLGEISDMKYGRMPKKEDIVDFGYPIFSGYRVTGYHKECMFDEPQLIVVARGVGGTGDVKISPPKCFLTNLSIAVVLNEKIADKKYLYYNFQKRNLKFLDTGSAQSQITISDLKRHVVSLPALPEQQAIAATLSALDDKIELNNRINKKLEEMAQAIFKRWFVDFEFPDENGQPYKSSGGAMEESELGLIPKGWKVKQLGDVITLSTKTVNPQNHNTKLFEHFSIPCFDDKKTPILEVGENIKSNKFVINSANILVSKLNPSTKRIWKPLCSTSNAVCSTEFMVYIARNDEHTDFYYSLMDSVEFQNYLLAHVTGSTNSRQRVTPSSTLFFKYVEPADPILKKFVEIAKPVFSKTQINTIENCRLMKTRDSLLPKLMSGEIRVPVEEVSDHV